MPFRQVPILEVDGVIIPQSTAIYRFLGQQFGRFISLSATSAICQVGHICHSIAVLFAGLVPDSPIEAALVDAAYDAHKDFLVGCRSFFSICYGFLQDDRVRTASWPLYNPYKLIYFFKNAYSASL